MIRIPKPKKKQTDEEKEHSFSERLDLNSACDEVISDELSEKDELEGVLSSAYRILQSGANSRRMLREKLIKKGYGREIASKAVAICEKQGMLFEKRLLLAHTEYLARKKHYGKSRIRLVLLQKFDRESVEEYFDEAIGEIDFAAYAKEEAEKGAHRGKRYLVSRLHTLGYSSSEIYKALDGIPLESESFDS